jgi:hypothetical protein
VFRDAMMPIFLRLAARAVDTAWIHRYHIDWNSPVEPATPATR